VLSKYVGAREKDDRFVRTALAAGLASPETLVERLRSLLIDEPGKERIVAESGPTRAADALAAVVSLYGFAREMIADQTRSGSGQTYSGVRG
jgi:hypothetical protein